MRAIKPIIAFMVVGILGFLYSSDSLAAYRVCNASYSVCHTEARYWTSSTQENQRAIEARQRYREDPKEVLVEYVYPLV